MSRKVLAVLGALMISGSLRADVWVITPSGYYTMNVDEDGVPQQPTPAPGVTGHVFMGTPDGSPPPPPPPGEDRWGLVKESLQAADAVTGDPKRDETAVKIGATYNAIGNEVQKGTIRQNQLKIALQLAYNAAVGGQKGAWESWKNTTDAAYNDVTFANALEAGQGLKDIGRGATNSGRGAIGDGTFLKFLIEVLIPLILEIIKLLNPPDDDSATEGVGLEASISPSDGLRAETENLALAP